MTAPGGAPATRFPAGPVLLPWDEPPATPHRPAARARGRRRRRRRTRRRVAAGVVLLLVAVAATAIVRDRLRGSPLVCGTDGLQTRQVAGLAEFAGWLRQNRVAGYVGEIGWPAGGPDAAQWSALADTWYRAADQAGLPVTAWAAARWPSDYRMAVYTAAAGTTTLNRAGAQATVVERHPTRERYLRGVVVAGGSFGMTGNSGFSTAAPGRYGYDYSYENAAGYHYLAARGVRLIRLAVAWERIQPAPHGPLDVLELARLRRAIALAGASGLVVVLDLHNYGRYALPGRGLLLGDPGLPVSALGDVWSRLARATADLPGVLGYDLMNEPLRLARRGTSGATLWQQASAQAVAAIRAAGGRRPVFVAGYGQPAPGRWAEVHPAAWIRDPLHRVVYETHVYFDGDNSGRYASSYARELASAAGDRPGCLPVPDVSSLEARALEGS